MFRFKCKTCGEVHEGMPTFGWDYPIHLLDVPEDERENRVSLEADTCVIDGKWFFVKGCIEIPVYEEEEAFSWGAWVSLSEKSFKEFIWYLDEEKRSHVGPFLGWLCSHIRLYPDTINLKARVHLRDNNIRPYIELEPTDHPLAIEQKQGIPIERVADIYEEMIHPVKSV